MENFSEPIWVSRLLIAAIDQMQIFSRIGGEKKFREGPRLDFWAISSRDAKSRFDILIRILFPIHAAKTGFARDFGDPIVKNGSKNTEGVIDPGTHLKSYGGCKS
jgi:hypothetical protein